MVMITKRESNMGRKYNRVPFKAEPVLAFLIWIEGFLIWICILFYIFGIIYASNTN